MEKHGVDIFFFVFSVWVAVYWGVVHHQAQDWHHCGGTFALYTGPVPVCPGSLQNLSRGPCTPSGQSHRGKGREGIQHKHKILSKPVGVVNYQ